MKNKEELPTNSDRGATQQTFDFDEEETIRWRNCSDRSRPIRRSTISQP